MFLNSLGQKVAPEESIFPLVTFYPKKQYFKCLGTGFFINPFGGFVTAKHVFFENDGSHIPTLYGVQSLNNGRRVIRALRHFVPHPAADIAMGFLGKAVNNPRFLNRPPIASAFGVSLRELNINDDVKTFAFPQTKLKELNDDQQLFTFKGQWANGHIVEYCPEGSPLVRNPCYQTTMNILDGASGGPVLRNGYVVGVNSSGMEIGDGGDPISFITPISFIQDLILPEGNEMITVRSLIKNGSINSEK